ncbi:PREDICTED: elongation of very long chain fatty acids protein AAEL008004-like [Vollenhovia emeryi]|uniref:elongation of very long chain fatty acids protein AAEL008004-like n=1 Tax=Vollenhovia emeryi TaxID=411798 RepID=UPI0005F57FC8|nr:PREDICTED: elongation of very long chain fatty acids protein AAEL008004-like [Vollenhovia emeryi]XP_011883088.1 PREDICTED: elongation of very long chain fatty acids protein AAEL008004-like [Vollenhovia emeryi]XP_011883098.1 PREDICTED: elongation of very long chain fatty acids protein AAEL008004-like [Vollenhovia emeryi]
MGLFEIYNYWNTGLSHPVSRDWFVSSPFPLLLLTVGYLYFVLYAGPRYMKNRTPFKLRTVILIYDLIQILANLWLLKQQYEAGCFVILTEISVKNCWRQYASIFDVPKLHIAGWYGLLLKIFDFIETCIFVLRKKQNQVSVLHVYHHISNVTFVWIALKYFMDVRTAYVTIVNCIVHVIMYMYYFISAWSPNLQRMMSPIKPFITILQMASINTIFCN